MDLSYQGGRDGSHNLAFTPRTSAERTSPGLPYQPTLQQHQPASQSHSYQATISSNDRNFPQATLGEPSRGRKNSIRHVVRKFFGRRSRDIGQEERSIDLRPDRTYRPQTSGHAYHMSEIRGLQTTEELPEPEEPPRLRHSLSNDRTAQRTLSVPALPDIAHGGSKSPYAVAFPSHSLKPLDLPNPFTAPNQRLRRRKTTSKVVEARGVAAKRRVTTRRWRTSGVGYELWQGGIGRDGDQGLDNDA